MAKKYELKYLSEEFYKKYNPVDYPEIEKKKERPYMVMLIKLKVTHLQSLFVLMLSIPLVTDLKIHQETLKVQQD